MNNLLSNIEITEENIMTNKMTLKEWKKENNIYTASSKYIDTTSRWACWDGTDDPTEYINLFGNYSFGMGNTEIDAIKDFCNKNNIHSPYYIWS